MTRLAHITDQHWCMASRWAETQRVARWCVERLSAERPDFITLGGDLADRDRPSVEELRAMAEWVQALANIAPVVGVSGNHDPEGLGAFLNLVEAQHPIYIADRPEVYRLNGVEFALLPWPRKAHLLALLEDAGAQEASQIGNELLLNVVRGLGVSEHEGPRVFVGHVQLRGAKVSTGQPLAPGADFELGLEDLALARCEAYLLGHIHLPQDLEIEGAPVCMGGSFRRTAYGEVEEKSIVGVELGLGGLSARVRRLPIPCQRMVLLEAEWTGEHWDNDPYPPADQVAGSDIRFRYRYAKDQAEHARAAAEDLRSGLLADGAAEVKLDPQVIPAGEARAPEVAKARTVREKLKALWKVRDAALDEDRQTRLLDKAAQIDSEVA